MAWNFDNKKHPLVLEDLQKESEYAILEKQNEPNLSYLPKTYFKGQFGLKRP